MAEQLNATLQWEFAESETVRPHCPGNVVVAGHTPQDGGEVVDLGFLKVDDTDASRGGWLAALEVRGGTIVQANELGHIRRSSRPGDQSTDPAQTSN